MSHGLSASAQDTRTALRDSLALVSERLAYRPDSIDLRLKKAALDMQLERWSHAKEEYDLVLRLERDNLAALYFRAYANERLMRYQFARADYENLLTLVPGNFEATLGLALLNQKDHRPTEALNQLNHLVEQHPDSAVAWAARGGVEAERGFLELAEFDYSKAVALDPSNTDYLLARADVRLQAGKKNDARDDLERLLTMGIPQTALKDFFQRCK